MSRFFPTFLFPTSFPSRLPSASHHTPRKFRVPLNLKSCEQLALLCGTRHDATSSSPVLCYISGLSSFLNCVWGGSEQHTEFFADFELLVFLEHVQATSVGDVIHVRILIFETYFLQILAEVGKDGAYSVIRIRRQHNSIGLPLQGHSTYGLLLILYVRNSNV